MQTYSFISMLLALLLHASRGLLYNISQIIMSLLVRVHSAPFAVYAAERVY